MEEKHWVYQFYLVKGGVCIGITPYQRDYYILFEDMGFWGKYEKILYFYKNFEKKSIETNLLIDQEIFDIYNEIEIEEDCTDDLGIEDYLRFSEGTKLIHAKVINFGGGNEKISARFERIEGHYLYSVNDPCYYHYSMKLTEAFIEEKEVLVVIDSETNYILTVQCPFDISLLTKPEIVTRIVPKLLEIINKVSSIRLPDHELLNKVDEINLNKELVCYYIHSNKICYYLAHASNWLMTLCQMRLPNEEKYPKLDFCESRVQDYLAQFEISIEDLRQSMRYLIDMEKHEKVKAFLPSFYYNFPNKEFISFYRVTDNYIEELLPGWTGVHKPFFDLIPEEHKYWVIDGKDWSKEFF